VLAPDIILILGRIDSVAERAEKVRTDNGLSSNTPVLRNLLDASTSGLNPHFTPDVARPSCKGSQG